jgi:hypothetical protein
MNRGLSRGILNAMAAQHMRGNDCYFEFYLFTVASAGNFKIVSIGHAQTEWRGKSNQAHTQGYATGRTWGCCGSAGKVLHHEWISNPGQCIPSRQYSLVHATSLHPAIPILTSGYIEATLLHAVKDIPPPGSQAS